MSEHKTDFAYHYVFGPRQYTTSEGDDGWHVECEPRFTPGGPLEHCDVTIDVSAGTKANAERLARALVESGAKIRVRPRGAIVEHVPLRVILPELDVPADAESR